MKKYKKQSVDFIMIVKFYNSAISTTDAKNALKIAQKYLLIIKRLINKNNPQLSFKI